MTTPTPEETVPASPTPGTPATGGPGATAGPGKTSTPPTGPMTLTGHVTAGVEPGCLLLDNYLLVGGPRDVLKAGALVTVKGRVRPDLMSTCQQGVPFMVESATAG